MAMDTPVELFSIGPQEAGQIAPLLTAEAADLLRAGEAFGLAVVEEGEARGAVCARLSPESDRSLELISFYVAPAYRRRRLGGTLLLELLEACEEELDGTIEAVEASFFPEPGLEGLLAKAGFRIEPAGKDLYSRVVPTAKLADAPLMKLEPPPLKDCRLIPAEELSPFQIQQLFQTLERKGADYMEPEQLANALPGPSYVLTDAGQRPLACAIFTGQGNSLCLSQFFIASPRAAAAVAVLQASARSLIERYPEGQLEIPLLASSSAKLVERLLGGIGERKPLLRAVLEM